MSLITKKCENEIKEAARVEEVLKDFIPDLKQKGANYTACCPFHGEKTPSFHVTPAKGIYKCFGCGVSGNAITFLMEHEKMSYPEALSYLAKKYGIAIERAKQDDEVERKADNDYSTVMIGALAHYNKALAAAPEVLKVLQEERGLDMDTILDWQLGFAPNDFKFLTTRIIEKGFYEPAKALGIIKTKVKEKTTTNYDCFRNRIMVPIHSSRGKVLGFGGRKLEDGNKENPKWLNSSDTPGFFEKGRILFGLHKAGPAIRKEGFALLVEGYMDAICMHMRGMENTVATMGTAFTEEQAKLLAKFTRSVFIMRDNDAAGHKSALEAVEQCIKHGLKPYIVTMPVEGDDPDTFSRRFMAELAQGTEGFAWQSLRDYVEATQKDGVAQYMAYKMNRAKSVIAKEEAVEQIVELLSNISNAITREDYIALLKKEHKADVRKQVAAKVKEREGLQAEKEQSKEGKLPPWAMKKLSELEYNGFIAREDKEKPDEWGFYIRKSGTSLEKICNFTFKFIMHIRDDDDDKRLMEVNNGYVRQYIDMPSKSVVSLDQFTVQMYQLEGNMLFEGDRKQLFKLLTVLGRQSKVAHELKRLGYQREGFFAFSNGIVDAAGKFIAMDQYGLVNFNGYNYYSPSASVIYKNRRDDNDPYENDRYLSYTKAAVKFEQWARQFCLVYKENNMGPIGVAIVMVALFRDVVFRIDNNCPHLSLYGESGSGKSKAAESISNIFLNNLRPLNLFHSTDFALANRLTRYSNALVWCDEFNDLTMKEDRFEAVKAAYEGVIRERGKGGSKNKTEILKTQSLLVLTGQYLSTKDDMAAINRCIVVPFEKRSGEHARTIEEIKQYEVLKGWEREGLSSVIVELLQHREEVVKDYPDSFAERFNELRKAVTEQGVEYNERVLRNYSALLTMWKIFSSKYSLPVSYADFFTIMRDDVIRLSRIITNSNALADWWSTVIYLLETGEIMNGFHFKVEEHTGISVTDGDDSGKQRKSKQINFTEPKKLLFIRLTTIHKMYLETYRRTNGKNGLSLATLELYLNRENGFIGKSAASRFTTVGGGTTNTSSYVFDYAALGVQLESEKPVEEEATLVTITGRINYLKQEEVAGKPMLTFTHCELTSYYTLGHPTEVKSYTKCYDANLQNREVYESEQELKVTGMLKMVNWTDKEGKIKKRRTLTVTKVEAIQPQSVFTKLLEQKHREDPPPPPSSDDEDLPF